MIYLLNINIVHDGLTLFQPSLKTPLMYQTLQVSQELKKCKKKKAEMTLMMFT